MKKFLLTLSLALLLFPVWAETGSSLSLALDLRGLDALFLPTLQAEVELRLEINNEFSLRTPVFLTCDLLYQEVELWEFGLFLDYHPFQNGLYLSVSLIQMGIFSGLTNRRRASCISVRLPLVIPGILPRHCILSQGSS